MATPSGLSFSEKKKIDLKKCIICQKVKDNQGSRKLTSTENGRNNLFRCSEILNDKKFNDIEDAEKHTVQYHVNTCYQRYLRLAERSKQREEAMSSNVSTEDSKENDDPSFMPRVSKRRKSEEKTPLCVVCNQVKCKGDKNLFRIETDKRAKELLAACKFFKDVFTRCSLMGKPGDVFAADVLYHRNCLNSYILKFKRELETLIAVMEDDDTVNESSMVIIDDALGNLKLENTAYSLSSVRDHINQKLESREIGMLLLHILTFTNAII